ncbi:spindle pole body component 110 isoform X2 [Monomorium pharaonis]|uniref:spindle pole body component 110 isoform X2 n=1 Tax=Monomorium pharaonis TaxID=307658 RepID=UPI0017478EFA|nr:spindle pole body component 110 isoform X2 [Monomorium pharaonis]
MKNNDLTNKLIQANEAVSKNAEFIAKLDEKNRMALTHESIKYDAMVTQKHSDIVKLREENQSLRDQLRETESKLAWSNETISSLRRESDNAAAINVLRASLSDLDVDKERLLAKVDYLKSEIASYRSSTASVESRLQALSHGNETLRADIEAVKSTNDQLLYPHEDTVKSSLKDALYTLPKKIYETILRLRTEIDAETVDISEHCLNKEAVKIEDEREKPQTKVYVDKSCQQDGDTMDPVAQKTNWNSENSVHKLRFLEGQDEEKLREIKNLMDDVKLRDCEIKSLQEYITHLLQKKNDLQAKVKDQVKEYQSKLTLLKKKYDSSLNAFHKRHNENIERLQARFEDIMKMEKSSFDAESWLQSLNLKELSELHNRINILSSHAAENTELDIAHIETKKNDCWNNSQEHRFYNKFTLRKRYTRQDKSPVSRKTSKEELYSKILNAENDDKIAVTELYSRDLRLKQKRSFSEDKKGNAESPNSRTDRTLDRQREKFIYQCSIHHKLSNAR